MGTLHLRKSRDVAVLPSPTEAMVRRALEAAGCRYTAQARRSSPTWRRSRRIRRPRRSIARSAAGCPRSAWPRSTRRLEALVEARLATKLNNGDGSARYDCRGEDHYHLRDIATGEVRDLPVEFDAELLAKIDPELIDKLSTEGFQVTGYRLEVLGRFQR